MLIFIFVFLIFIFLHLYFKKKYNYWEKRGVKGPKPAWFLGTTLDEIFYDPIKKEREYTEKYGYFFGTYNGVKPIFNTSKPEHIKQILNNINIFHHDLSLDFSDNYFSKSIVAKNGKDWENGKKSFSHFFTATKIKSLFGQFESSIDNFIKNVEFFKNKKKSDSIDFKILSNYMTIDLISKILFSININSFEEKQTNFVLNSIKICNFNILRIFFMNILPESLASFLNINGHNVNAMNKIGDMFKIIMKKRQNSPIPYNDLVQIIKETNETKNLGLTENEIIGNASIGYFAGVNFVSDGLCSIIYHLIHNLDVKERLIKEIEKDFMSGIEYDKLVNNAFLDAVINESLRLIVSVRMITRKAIVDTEIDGIKIEKGIEVNALNWVASNSEENFPNPKIFDPNRFLDKSSSNPNKINGYTFLPFGDGPRTCIAKRFSLVFMKFFIVKFFLMYDVYKPKDYKKKSSIAKDIHLYNNFVIGLKKKVN